MPSPSYPDDLPRSRERRSPRRPRDVSRGYDDDHDFRQRRRHPSRHDSPRDSGSRPSKPRDDYDASDEDDLIARKPSSREKRRHGHRPSDDSPPLPRPPIGKDRDDEDDYKPRRRRHEDDEPRRRRRDYDEPPAPRRKDGMRDYAREDDDRRYKRSDRHRRHYDDDDTDPEPPAPRRRRDKERDRDRYEDRGYRTDGAPRRRDRDDYDRGYKTDYNRDSRRDRERRREKERSRGDDYDRYDKYDRRDRDRRDDRDRRRSDRDRDGRHQPKKKKDLGEMIQTGQKHWNKVEPVAKPMLNALAKKYLES